MNKIVVKNDLIEPSVDDSITVKKSLDLVPKYEITITSSSSLVVFFEGESKLSVEYIVKDSVKANIFEFRKLPRCKVRYKYEVKDNAHLYLYRLNSCETINENDVVNLSGLNSKVEFNLRTLAIKGDNYNVSVNHTNKNTVSVIDNIGIALKGGIRFNVTGSVIKGCSGSILDQNNKIVTLDASKSSIDPNLLVDEYDVVAEHNATIGSFDEDVLFYLMSRGIDSKSATKLIAEGLVLNNLKDESLKENVKEIINEYWG